VSHLRRSWIAGMVTQRLFAGLTCAAPLALERGVGATVSSLRKMGQAGRAATLRETATLPRPFAPLRVKRRSLQARGS
jgi:hypothetical protein